MAETRLNIALCQLNPVLGDLDGNAALILGAYERACSEEIALVIFPEMMLPGYPPQDLVLQRAFQKATLAKVDHIIAATAGKPAAMILGTLWCDGEALYNAALFIEDGKIRHIVKKHHLPNDGVFDEKRVFAAGELADPIFWRGRQLGLLVCEDMWHDDAFVRLARQGADAVIVINASPFEDIKHARREEIVTRAAAAGKFNVFYCNMVAGQDQLVFDGQSFIANASGEVVHRSPAFVTDTAVVLLGIRSITPQTPDSPLIGRIAAIYGAAVLGLRDYVIKNGMSEVLLGLSGGIDSALVATMAADALGPDKVRAVMLPYRYTSEESLADAAEVAAALGIAYSILPIEEGMAGMMKLLAPLKGSVPSLLAFENLQSRMRGMTLMAISNSTSALLLSTGNKSELAMGYATLYGDMCGAYNPLRDIYKTDVFALARWRNANLPLGAKGPKGPVIPERVITRPPSAELREDQKDSDSLPPYEELDPVLRLLIEERQGTQQIVAAGHPRAMVERVVRLFYSSEYKRFQAPPGPKVSSMNFGFDRRYPMTNRWKD